jgi:hypothetical protein
MKVSIDVSDGGDKTLFVESFYDLSEAGMPTFQLAQRGRAADGSVSSVQNNNRSDRKG